MVVDYKNLSVMDARMITWIYHETKKSFNDGKGSWNKCWLRTYYLIHNKSWH